VWQGLPQKSSFHAQGAGDFFLALVERKEGPGGKRPRGGKVPQVKSRNKPSLPFLQQHAGEVGFCARPFRRYVLEELVHLGIDVPAAGIGARKLKHLSAPFIGGQTFAWRQ
jgi:hypothetical protein